jgi:hypothetical protein
MTTRDTRVASVVAVRHSQIMVGERGTSVVELGRAETSGQRLPLDSDDLIPAARAVRRALAAAHRHAIDVEALLVVVVGRPTDEVLRRFARRALGPHGAIVRVGWSTPSRAASALDVAVMLDLADRMVGMVVAIDSGGTCLARCVAVTSSLGLPKPPGRPA